MTKDQEGYIQKQFRFALSWGMTYGPLLRGESWEEMSKTMADQFTQNVKKELLNEKTS